MRFLSYGSPLLVEILSGLPELAGELLLSRGLSRCTAAGDFEFAAGTPGRSLEPLRRRSQALPPWSIT